LHPENAFFLPNLKTWLRAWQKQVRKLTIEFFYRWSLLRDNNMAQFFKCSLHATVVGVLPRVTVERTHHGR